VCICFRLDKSMTLNMRVQQSNIVSCHDFFKVTIDFDSIFEKKIAI